MTSLQSKQHIQNIDATWMQWLRKCSAIKGSSDVKLLNEYAESAKMAWHESLQQLCSTRCSAWPFLRGQLSVAEIADARRRYLDKYVFVAGEHSASDYVEALLRIETAQIQLRLNQNKVTCPGCADRDAIIAKMRMALQARNLCTAVDVDAAAVSNVFYRCFMLSEKHTCTRTQVRERIQEIMQNELGNGFTLASNSKAWTTFLRDRLGISSSSSNAIRCVARRYVLPAVEPDEPDQSAALAESATKIA